MLRQKGFNAFILVGGLAAWRGIDRHDVIELSVKNWGLMREVDAAILGRLGEIEPVLPQRFFFGEGFVNIGVLGEILVSQDPAKEQKEEQKEN